MIKKKFILIPISLLFISVTKAGNGNVYLDGENKITLGNSFFANETEWTDFSTFVPLTTLSPLQTDWFTHNGKVHIVIQLTNSRSNRLLLGLGSKKTYVFKEIRLFKSELLKMILRDNKNNNAKDGSEVSDSMRTHLIHTIFRRKHGKPFYS